MRSLAVFILVVLSLTIEINFAQAANSTNASAPGLSGNGTGKTNTTGTGGQSSGTGTHTGTGGTGSGTSTGGTDNKTVAGTNTGGGDHSAAIFLSPSMKVLAPVLAASFVALLGSIH